MRVWFLLFHCGVIDALKLLSISLVSILSFHTTLLYYSSPSLMTERHTKPDTPHVTFAWSQTH